MRLDSHQHFWSYDREQYPWIPERSPLHREWLPADLAELQRPLRLEGSVAVQARQTLEELQPPLNRFLHELHPYVAFGIVPLFALANSGVSLSGLGLAQVTSPVFLGIFFGLILGKPLGIVLVSRLTGRLAGLSMPGNVGPIFTD